jgi:hypothetical protein
MMQDYPSIAPLDTRDVEPKGLNALDGARNFAFGEFGGFAWHTVNP